MLLVEVQSASGGDASVAEKRFAEALRHAGLSCEAAPASPRRGPAVLVVRLRDEGWSQGSQGLQGASVSVVDKLRSELESKNKALCEMEESLGTAMESIKTFHKQQNDLFEEFVSLRDKYDSLKGKMRRILWEFLPENVVGFEDIPRMQPELSEGEDRIGEWQLGAVLGEGQFAVVKEVHGGPSCFKGGRALGASDVAVKRILKDKITDIKNTRRINNEVRILRNLDHANIVKLIDVLHTPNYLYLVQERGGLDLFEFYRKNPGPAKEAWARSIVQQLASALAYLARHNVVHRDLKPENVLVGAGGAAVKLVDFGLSTENRAGMTLDDFCGTPGFFAPEMLLRKHYDSSKLDAWSLGCVLLEMLLGHVCFAEVWMPAYAYEHLHDAQAFERELQKCLAAVQTIFGPGLTKAGAGGFASDDLQAQHESLLFKNHRNRAACLRALKAQQGRSQDCRDLLLATLVKEPEQRLDCAQLAQHPFAHESAAGQPQSQLQLQPQPQPQPQHAYAHHHNQSHSGQDVLLPTKPSTPPGTRSAQQFFTDKNGTLQTRRPHPKNAPLSVVTAGFDPTAEDPALLGELGDMAIGSPHATQHAHQAQHAQAHAQMPPMQQQQQQHQPHHQQQVAKAKPAVPPGPHGSDRARLPPISPASPKLEGAHEILKIGDTLMAGSSFKA